MLHTGLLSVTFRSLPASRIVELASQAGLDSIEWGGDVHVPHGDVVRAGNVRQMTTDRGLSISAYGSYYRLAEASSPPIDAVLDTADALGTKMVRVWAGQRGSNEADADYRQAVIDDARRVIEKAAARSLCISLEYHNNTLTDTLESTLSLLNAVNHDKFRSFWQPPHTPDLNAKKQGLRTLLSRITNVHVFHWNPNDHRIRYPLADGEADWLEYIHILRASDHDHVLSLEFVRDDDEGQFLKDAGTLLSWVSS